VSDRVNVVNPSGEVVSLPKEQVPAALTETGGYTLATPEQVAANKPEQPGVYGKLRAGGVGVVPAAAAAIVAGPQSGALQAWQQGGIRGATAGLGNVAEKELAETLFDKQSGGAVARGIQKVQEAHPTIFGAGELAGMAAGTAVGGAAGAGGTAAEAFAASNPASLISGAGDIAAGAAGRYTAGLAARGVLGRAAATGLVGAARYGTGAALYGAATEASEEALGDQQLAAEKILMAGAKQGAVGALFGGALGAGGSLLKSGASSLKRAAMEGLGDAEPTLRKQANLQRANILDPSYKIAREAEARFRPIKEGDINLPGGKEGIGDVLKRRVKVPTAATAEEIQGPIAAAQKQVGRELGDLRASSPASVTWGELFDETEKVVSEARKTAGNEATVHGLEAYQNSLAEKLGVTARAQQMLKHAATPEDFKAGQAALREMKIPVQDVIEQQTGLGQIVYREGQPLNASPRVEGLRTIRAKMNELTLNAIDAVAKDAGDEGVATKLRVLAHDYQGLNLASDAAERTSTGMKSNRTVGLRSYLAGGAAGHAGAAAGGLVAGAPGAAVGHVVGGLGGAILHQTIQRRGSAMAAAALDKVADIAAAARLARESDLLITDAAKGLAGKTKGLGAKYSATPLATRYAEAVKRVAAVQAAHQAFADHMQSMTIPNAPNVSAAMTITASRQMQFLASQIPPSVNRPAIGVHEKQPRASVSDMTRFMHIYDAVTDPQQVLKNLAAGKVNTHEVFALKNMSPKVYEQLQQQALIEVTRGEANAKPLTHEQRLKLGVVLDVATDPSLEPGTLKRLQQSIVSTQGKKENAPDKGSPSRPVHLQMAEPSGLDRLDSR